MFRGIEELECFVLKNLKLRAGEMLGRKPMRDKAKRSVEEQQADIARLQTKVKYYKKQKNRNDQRDRAGRSESACEGSSRTEPKKGNRKK